MRSIFSLMLAALLAFAVVGDLAASPLPASVGFDAVSSYVYRGALVSDEWTIQPNAAVDLGASGLALELKGSFVTSQRDVYESADEVDFTVAYERGLGAAVVNPVQMRVGYTQHTYPNAVADYKHTEEAFLGVHASLPLVQGGLTLARDFNLLDGNYVRAHVSPPASLLQMIPIPGVSLDFGLAYSDYDESFGFHDFDAKLSFDIPLVPFVTAGPMLGYSYGADEVAGEDNDNWWGGVTLQLHQ